MEKCLPIAMEVQRSSSFETYTPSEVEAMFIDSASIASWETIKTVDSEATLDAHSPINRQKYIYQPSETSNVKIIELFLNGRITAVTLQRDEDPEMCRFLPILNQVVVISNVEPGAECYAEQLQNEEGYKIVTISPETVAAAGSVSNLFARLPSDAIRGRNFEECSLQTIIQHQYYRQLVMDRRKNPPAPVENSRLIVRFGETESFERPASVEMMTDESD